VNSSPRLSASGTRPRRVAIVHDWLPVYGGAERVLEQMIQVFPEADLFSVVDLIPPADRGFLQNKSVETTFIQKLPFSRRHYRGYLPLMPLAIEQFDLSLYDLVISSSYAVAKGVITGPTQVHICYTHSPVRFAWDLQHQYLEQTGMAKRRRGVLVRLLLHYIRLWDVRTSAGVDSFVANSGFVARRIEKVYRRQADAVIYPPVDVDRFQPREHKEDFYLSASRLVPYKRIDLIVEAFADLPGKKLIVVGDGPEMPKLRKVAGPNVCLMGHQPQEVLIDLMQRARGFIFAAEEDFGIVPLEAQACGTPVLAYRKGGALETVIEGRTGSFFEEQTVESLRAGLRRFEAQSFSWRRCRQQALAFSAERFRREFAHFVLERFTYFSDAGRYVPGALAAVKLELDAFASQGAPETPSIRTL